MEKAKVFRNVHRIEDIVGLDFVPVPTVGNGWTTAPPIAGLAHINRYLTKSWEDYVNRMRTQPCFNARTFDTFFMSIPT
jgi:hypothetical protein